MSDERNQPPNDTSVTPTDTSVSPNTVLRKSAARKKASKLANSEPQNLGKPAKPRKPPKRAAHRPTKKTPQAVERILEILGVGGTFSMAAAAAGISTDTLVRWRDSDAAFAGAIARAKDVGAVKLVDTIRNAAAAGDWRAAQWLVERTMPDQYGRRVMVGGIAGGAPISIKAESDAAEAVRSDPDALRALHEAALIAAGAAVAAHSNGKAGSNGSV